MNLRELTMKVLHYEIVGKVPIVHFGFWTETLDKWEAEGHITAEEKGSFWNVGLKLGFDFDWYESALQGVDSWNALRPPFEPRLLEITPDGFHKVCDTQGAVLLQKPGCDSIPPEVDHILKDRDSWEKEFLPRLQWHDERYSRHLLEAWKGRTRTEAPVGYHIGSLIGEVRNYLGVVGLSYLYADEYDLLCEICSTIADIRYRQVKYLLENGLQLDFAHFWEDICFKNGPLVTPSFFHDVIGPHYKRITDVLHQYGVQICSVDCDGCIDALLPTFLENGVNTMFPIEVGTWQASIAPWREKYGRELRGIGGMNKNVFAMERADIDREIERLKPLVELGGYIPCPDHRIPPTAKYENVQYYCQQMRKAFN